MASCENKYITLLDLSRQAKVITGETACFDGKIQVGLPFSGYPTGVDITTAVSLGVVSSETAVLSGNTGTTIFDVSNTSSPNYDVLFSGYSGTVWTNDLFSGNTSGLTLPITPLSADTQIVGPFWTLTKTGMTGDYVIGTEYTGYSITYSVSQLQEISFITGFTAYSGFSSASQENFSAGTLDYKGPLDYISSVEDATIDGRLTTNKLTVTGGASASTIGYVLTQLDETGKAGWVFNSASASTNTFVTGGTLNGTNLNLTWNTGGVVPSIELSGLTFTGNTSGDCITDLYLTNLHGCSPVTVHDNLQHIGSSATGINSIAWGTGTTASGIYSHAEGFSTTASGITSHAEGLVTIAGGQSSHAEGQNTNSIGGQSHAEGISTIASGIASHAEGSNTIAIGITSHAEGYYTTAHTASHSEGQFTLASGVTSHSEGTSTVAIGDFSHAEGLSTTASGEASHAEGSSTIASGDFSHAGGSVSTASGNISFIHSVSSLVTGDRSVVLGGQNITGVTDDTVYVPNLNIGTLSAVTTGTTIIDNLGVESNGLVVKSYTTKRLEIGDWDMTANTQTTVSHGLSATEWKTILRSDALIRNDSDTVYAPLNGIEAPSTGLPNGGVAFYDSTNITLSRYTTGDFDTNDFNSTSYNRGWITFDYIKD